MKTTTTGAAAGAATLDPLRSALDARASPSGAWAAARQRGDETAAILAGLDAPSIAWHYAAGVGVLAFCFALFALNWIGGGDAKLAAAIAVWTGPFAPLLEWAILAAILGGVLTLVILAARRLPLPVMLAGHTWIARLHDAKTGVPYGIALSGAALAMAPSLAIFLR